MSEYATHREDYEQAIRTADYPLSGSATPSEIAFNELTLRDGLQQRTGEYTMQDRVRVFDAIVDSGVDRIEIGHLGNKKEDQEFARQVIERIKEAESVGDFDKYLGVKLQVLFGSQKELIEDGSTVLTEAYIRAYPDTWQEEMASRVVVHVYDRIDEDLIRASNHPYTQEESAQRLAGAIETVKAYGFRHLSISAEAVTATAVEQAVEYYRFVIAETCSGIESINVNLANTYGFATSDNWNADTMAVFNRAVKYGWEEGVDVTTSVHAHNDTGAAVDYTMDAIAAGFDRIEGTHFGMGERSGNVPSVTIMQRLIESIRHEMYGAKSGIASKMSERAVMGLVRLNPRLVGRLSNWYKTAEVIATVFGEEADDRWRQTSLGSPNAHDNGSGPHDQVMAAAITDPVTNRPHHTYEQLLMPNSILGRPGTDDLMLGDPDAVDSVTVGNHAGGSKTTAIKEDTLTRACPSRVAEAYRQIDEERAEIVAKLLGGFIIKR